MQEYLGPEIISHFLIHGTSVADIVKHFITILKKKDCNIPVIFLEAMKRVRIIHLVYFFIPGTSLTVCVCVRLILIRRYFVVNNLK